MSAPRLNLLSFILARLRFSESNLFRFRSFDAVHHQASLDREGLPDRPRLMASRAARTE
jgi:hypothetical protein